MRAMEIKKQVKIGFNGKPIRKLQFLPKGHVDSFASTVIDVKSQRDILGNGCYHYKQHAGAL